MLTYAEQTENKPVVMIVGGGLGGLMLGILLERINVPYHIFERATEIKPLGSAMSLSVNIMPVFEQLGLLDELLSFSVSYNNSTMYDHKLNVLGTVSMKDQKQICGYDKVIFARPKLHAMMLRQIPTDKITFGKRVLRTEEIDNKVLIHCSDNSTYSGDILVGADGAYSSVRQSLYKHLLEQGILPKSDSENLSLGYNCMVGVTDPLDPEKYPQLKDDFAHFTAILGKQRLSWGVVNVPGNQICWILLVQFDNADDAAEQRFRNSEWGPESTDAMVKEFRDALNPYGGTMGELIDATPKERQSKVFLEEKLFETWFHGRTVLVGDACHKMIPAAGQGAINAMQDAVILANCFYDMPDASLKSITAAFQDYFDQRYEHAKMQIDISKFLGKVFAGQSFFERIFRKMILNYIPDWMNARNNIKVASYRPQITWMPFAPNRGTGPILPQKPCKRYQKEQARRAEAQGSIPNTISSTTSASVV
ncbi:hypothetical protein BCR41DRAFT_384252 [Lobosporangium transversale]|uniref:FAD-binding domain-containing protein n=1 Tax=Lobosporangium transversale TaxID=64571 RepID=A0A1Y2GWJ0_9FUNG|nr:hypothetical protein BCR41DRAFT_384252 [Lobosporangium transversale]ORZ26666.1 hypothetical protein BCR41DRAFT_384252 [Lobosporangium transversale]|eukprot:XP_021884429.1 hypothetical protein BCR41DRAFT_384252 [Lobosporangium transversale]